MSKPEPLSLDQLQVLLAVAEPFSDHSDRGRRYGAGETELQNRRIVTAAVDLGMG